jgi:hypothetical protein
MEPGGYSLLLTWHLPDMIDVISKSSKDKTINEFKPNPNAHGTGWYRRTDLQDMELSK